MSRSPQPAAQSPWLISIACLAILALVVGVLAPPKDELFHCSVLSLASQPPNPDQPVVQGFAENAVYPATHRPSISSNIPLLGSWLGSDASTGVFKSAWFQTNASFYLLVAGYPDALGNSLSVELRTPGQLPSIVPIHMRPAEAWLPRQIRLPYEGRPYAVRVSAADHSQTWGGWFGVSYPFIYQAGLAPSLVAIGRLVLCIALTLVLVLGPGLLLRTTVSSPLWQSLALVPVPGLLYLTVTGLTIWTTASWIEPHKMALLSAILVAIPVAGDVLRRREIPLIAPAEIRVFLVILLIILVAVARASYSQGPAGELFGGTVSRTLEVGGRSDSRVPFHVVQLVASGVNPHGDAGELNFRPWSFSHRGPLAGIITGAIPLLSGARIPLDMPSQPWQPFDPQGFAAYRIGMIVLSGAALLALYGAAEVLLGAQRAYQVLLIAALSPFIVHEVYFTWPKIPAAGMVVLSFLLIVKCHPAWGGLALGAAYLFHPLALFSAPAAVVLISAVTLPSTKRPASSLFKWAKTMLAFFAPLLATLLFWRVVNAGHYEQTDFLNYFFLADGVKSPPISLWVQSRVRSVLDTLLPFYFLVERPDGTSGVIGFFAQYWATLPFGLGLAAAVPIAAMIVKAVRQAFWLFIGIVLVPFFIFAVYWGKTSSGLMREGLHAWLFLTVLCVAYCLSLRHSKPRMRRVVAIGFSARAIEVLFMLFVPAIATTTFLSANYALLDAAMLAVATAALAVLALLSYHALREMPEEWTHGR